MLKIIAVMFLGMGFGYLIRRVKGVAMVSVTIMLTIMLLLFIMGGEIGGNRQVIDNMLSLGGEALVIAVAATLGSVVAARYVYKFLIGRKGGGHAR